MSMGYTTENVGERDERHAKFVEGAMGALPSDRLEALKGDRSGQFSIRVNMQWRICFEWPRHAAGPSRVVIVDYH